MSIYCLLDTNCVVKRYHNEPGTDVIDYLFNDSPSALINLLNIQVVEVIKVFYSLRAQNKIKSDVTRDTLVRTFLGEINNGSNEGKIRLYDFANEHLKDMDVYDPIVRISQGWGKQKANTIDAILLIVMREIHFLTKEAYLVSADDHVLDVAKQLGLKTINPARIAVNGLPKSLDRRCERHKKSLKVILKGTPDAPCLGSGCSIDVSQNGLAMGRQSSLTMGRDIELKLSPLHREDPTIELPAKVVWSNNKGAGLKFSVPIAQDLFSQLILN